MGETVISTEEPQIKSETESQASEEELSEKEAEVWFVRDPPDPTRHLVPPTYHEASRGSLKECEREYRPIDFKQLYSYWVSVATKAGE